MAWPYVVAELWLQTRLKAPNFSPSLFDFSFLSNTTCAYYFIHCHCAREGMVSRISIGSGKEAGLFWGWSTQSVGHGYHAISCWFPIIALSLHTSGKPQSILWGMHTIIWVQVSTCDSQEVSPKYLLEEEKEMSKVSSLSTVNRWDRNKISWMWSAKCSL